MSYGFEAKMPDEHAASQAEELEAALGEALSPREDPGEDVQALRLERPDGEIVDVFVNLRADGRVMHENSHAVFGGLETDAFLCTLSYGRDGRLRRATLHNGSYLKLNGRCLFSSLLKASAAISYRGGEIEIDASLSADAWCYFSAEPTPNRTAEQAVYGCDTSPGSEACGRHENAADTNVEQVAGLVTSPESEAYERPANAAATPSASSPVEQAARRADLRFDPLSGLWKRKMPAGRSSFRLPLGASNSQSTE